MQQRKISYDSGENFVAEKISQNMRNILVKYLNFMKFSSEKCLTFNFPYCKLIYIVKISHINT